MNFTKTEFCLANSTEWLPCVLTESLISAKRVYSVVAISLTHLTNTFGALLSGTDHSRFLNGGLPVKLFNVAIVILVVAVAAFAQAADAPFQVRYAANLSAGESYIDIVNTGANGAPLLGPGLGGAVGNICVNVYAFDPGEEMIACCSCLVTPDQVVNLGVNRDLTAKTLTGVIPTSVTVKLLATLAGTGGSGTSCTNSATAVVTATPVAAGMAAWGTTLHATPTSGSFATTETPFTPATLSAGELASLGGRCSSIVGNASTFGVCSSCKAGALGAMKQ